jgi:hypothetical protein
MMTKPKMYAIEIKRTNYDLIRALNEGGDVATEKKKTYFVFEVSESGVILETEILTQRDMLATYDIAGHTPFILGLKRA